MEGDVGVLQQQYLCLPADAGHGLDRVEHLLLVLVVLDVRVDQQRVHLSPAHRHPHIEDPSSETEAQQGTEAGQTKTFPAQTLGQLREKLLTSEWMFSMAIWKP